MEMKTHDSYDRGCDTCPFKDECQAYKEAFGLEECFRDDWAKSLMEFIRHSGEESFNGQAN